MTEQERIFAFRSELNELIKKYGIQIVPINQISETNNVIVIDKNPSIKFMPMQGWKPQQEEIGESDGINPKG